MNGNITTAPLGGNRNIKTKPLFQYDYGQVLKIVGVTLPAAYEVHFSNQLHGVATTQIGNADGVIIPDIYLTTGEPVYAWIYLHTGNSDGETEYTITIPVVRRASISDAEPTPVQQDVITQAIAALNTAVEQTAQDVQDATEAKQDAEEAAGEAYESAVAAAQSAANAWTYAGQAQTAQAAAELAQQKAEEAQTGAQTAKWAAESAQTAAEAAQAGAVAARTGAETAQAWAVAARSGAEAAQHAAEAARDEITGLSATANTLPAGSQASASYSDGLLTIGVPKGDKGDTGDTGATPDLTIGTVQTLPAGSSATASITGTDEQPILNLGIPKGDAGEVTEAELTAALTPMQQDVSDLKSAFTDFAGLETTWETGFWTNQGAFNSDTNFKHSNYIPIKELAIPIHYTVKVVNTVPSYILFDEEKNYIKKYFDTDSTSLVEIDDVVKDFEGAAYIVFESYTGNNVYSPSLKYCDLSNSRVIGFIKEITLDDIPNKLITQEKLAFANLVLPTNLFDYTNLDYCIRSTWYYSTTIGNVVSPESNQYTTPYVAIKIPLYEGIEKVTFGIYPNILTRNVFWVGAVDADMKLINYQTVNTQPPITYTIPSGAKYLLVSYNLDASNFDAYIPTIMAVSGETITGYSEYHDPYYLLENCITETEPEPEYSAVKLILPESYNAVVGDTIQIFYKGIISATKPEVYDVKVQCAQGSAYARYFELTPTTAGNVSAVFSLYDQRHNLIDTKTVAFNVKAKASSPSAQKNVLCVGDSLTTGGVWPVELHRRLTRTGGAPAGDGLTNINFIGSRVVSGVGFEGYGGWTFNSYNTANVSTNAKIITCSHDKTEALDQHSIYKDGNNDTWKLETIESGTIKIIAVSSEGRNFPSTGTLTWVSGGTNHSSIIYTASENAPSNPFWNATANKVDFETYATEQGVSSIDYVLVLLGWNSAALSEEAYKEQAQTFITNVHASFPNAKIVLMGLEIPARDGLGANYGANGIYSDYYGLMQYVFNVDAWYLDLVNDNSNVFAVNLSGQFDTEYNMPTGTRQVNTRNTETITYQSNGVHPATPGYYQIADAFYRWIMGVLN